MCVACLVEQVFSAAVDASKLSSATNTAHSVTQLLLLPPNARPLESGTGRGALMVVTGENNIISFDLSAKGE